MAEPELIEVMPEGDQSQSASDLNLIEVLPSGEAIPLTTQPVVGEPIQPLPYSDFLQGAGQQFMDILSMPTFDWITGQKPNTVDYKSGIQDARLRTDLSMADTPAERAQVLNNAVGEGQWFQDPQGAYILLPGGQSEITKNLATATAIDESGLSRYDVVDLAGIGGPMMGAAAGAKAGALTAAPTMNPYLIGLGTLIGAGLGGFGGSVAQETGEAVLGNNLQTPEQIAAQASEEAAWSMAGEGFGGVGSNILGSLARGPLARLTGQRLADVEMARAMGLRPGVARILSPTEAPGRFGAMMHNIFGNRKRDAENFTLLYEKYLENLRQFGDELVDPESTGKQVKQGILTARQNLRDLAERAYQPAKDLLKNQGDVFPTWRLKNAANDILEQANRSVTTGEPLFISQRIKSSIRDIGELPDFISGPRWQNLTQELYVPLDKANKLQDGTNMLQAGDLYGAARAMLDDGLAEAARTGNVNVLDGLNAYRAATDLYREQIRQFDASILKRLVKDPRAAEYIPPDQVVRSLLKPNNAYNVRQVVNALRDVPRARDALAKSTIDALMDGKIVPDPKLPGSHLLDARALRKQMELLGEETLSALIGPRAYGNLQKFTTAAELVNRVPSQAGALVAAGITARPFDNLLRLTGYGILHRLLTRDVVTDWFTRGIQYPPASREGARFANELAGLTAMLSEDPERAAEYFETPEMLEKLEQYIPGISAEQQSYARPANRPSTSSRDLRQESDIGWLYGAGY